MNKLSFVKMQGCGNDYIYFVAEENPAVDFTAMDWEAIAIRLSDRHFGIGGDGIVLIESSEVADFRMRIFNADGSEAEMCGNASRCVGRYVSDCRMTDKQDISLETKGGIKQIHILPDGLITVDMGTELGNPHAVFFVDEITDNHVLVDGPRIECDPKYPHRTNVEFVRVLDRHKVRMRVWERGSGETMACGTGACATAMEAVAQGYCDYPVTVAMPGGELTIDSLNGHILMTGSGEVVYEGEVTIN